MNKNKNLVKAGALGLAAITAVSLGAGGYAVSHAGTERPAAVVRNLSSESSLDKETANTLTKGDNSGSPYKEEAVYVNADASGKVLKTTVSDWLKNAGAIQSLPDCSELTDIINVKGEEAFTKGNGSALTWQTAGSDIYYQGQTAKELPVSVNISYRLDGKQLLPEEIAGKSGKLVMHISYDNRSKQRVEIDGRKEEIYTPFTMITGIMLPVESFTNVTVDHGTVLSDGSRNIVMGLSFPGLKESLMPDGADKDLDFDLPEDVTISADVKNFKMESTITIASPDLLSRAGLDKAGSLEEWKDSLNKLMDASGELLDGSEDLADGVGELKTKSGDFSKGLQTLRDGLTSLSKGAGELEKGVRDYTEGAGTLAAGVNRYVDGAGTLAKGVKDYTAGAGALAQGINTLAGSAGELPEKLGELGKGLTELSSGLEALAGAEGIDALEKGAVSLAGGVEALNTGIDKVRNGVAAVHDNLAKLESAYANNEQLLAQLKAVEASAADPETKAALSQIIAALEQTTAAQKQGIASLREATAGDSTLGGGIAKLSEATEEGGTLQSGAYALKAGIERLVSGGAKLSEALPALTAGSSQIAGAAQTLPGALAQLKAGADKLTANNEKLNQGASSLISSGAALKKGAKALTDNSGKLLSGTAGLEAGAGKLYKGGTALQDGTKKLTDGIDRLFRGANELKDGMREFDETGIEKLNEVLNGDLQSLLDRFHAVLESSESYKNFSGISEGMDGSVKFIIETDAVKPEE